MIISFILKILVLGNINDYLFFITSTSVSKQKYYLNNDSITNSSKNSEIFVVLFISKLYPT